MRRGGAVGQGGAVGLGGDLDQAALQVSDVGLGQVLVLAGDDHRPRPEVLGLVGLVPGQARQHVVPLADGDPVLGRGFGVGADQQVDARAFQLVPPGEGGESGAASDRDLAGPVHDLGRQHAGRRAIDQVDPQRPARRVGIPAFGVLKMRSVYVSASA
jgi:hypothetical protein